MLSANSRLNLSKTNCSYSLPFIRTLVSHNVRSETREGKREARCERRSRLRCYTACSLLSLTAQSQRVKFLIRDRQLSLNPPCTMHERARHEHAAFSFNAAGEL